MSAINERILDIGNGLKANNPRMLPMRASPQSFRLTATIPPSIANIERMILIVPQMRKICRMVSAVIDRFIDWNCVIDELIVVVFIE